MTKARARLGHFVIVPNGMSLDPSKKRVVKTQKKRRWGKLAGSKDDLKLIARAVQANRRSRAYDLVEGDDNAFFVVRDKATGRLISKFEVDSDNKHTPVRKLSLKTRTGTISVKRIFDAI